MMYASEYNCTKEMNWQIIAMIICQLSFVYILRVLYLKARFRNEKGSEILIGTSHLKVTIGLVTECGQQNFAPIICEMPPVFDWRHLYGHKDNSGYAKQKGILGLLLTAPFRLKVETDWAKFRFVFIHWSRLWF